MMQNMEGLRSGSYKSTKKLKLSCRLSNFPHEILELSDLEILDLSGTHLSQLPVEIRSLQTLKVAFFSDCKFTVFPKELAQCPALEMVAFKGNGMMSIPENSLPPNLRWLILTNNSIKTLPRSIGQCHRLQKCMLAGNQLSSLPEEMASCQKLCLLRISANRIKFVPDWVFQLPALAFLAFSGNDSKVFEQDNPELANIPWSALTPSALLGEGASGIISRGIWDHANGTTPPQHVAIKLFKGDITSDGSPLDEMNACIAAGSHVSLIDPLGRIRGHPEGKRGLVLQLIAPIYTNLGLPPTLQSCTRDSYPEGMVLSPGRCKSILLGISGALEHLHARGITHGDMYAHNILVNPEGHALLGDFGAATIYDKTRASSTAIEQLEVLAFGHLIEDMLHLAKLGGGGIQHDTPQSRILCGLEKLHNSCSIPVPTERPLFAIIHSAIQNLY